MTGPNRDAQRRTQIKLNWEMEIGRRKVESGNWKLECEFAGKWKLEKEIGCELELHFSATVGANPEEVGYTRNIA